jgi:hypothetical protein
MLSWNEYDSDIQNIVTEYNHYLLGTPGFVSLDWRLVKAMIWTETDPHAKHELWKTKPMQSDNPGDRGWHDMMGKPNEKNLIVPHNLQSAVASPNLTPADNIAAGVGYFLFRAAEFGPKTIVDKSKILSVTVEHGDSLDRIARRAGTSEQVLRDMNSGISLYPLKPGTKLT